MFVGIANSPTRLDGLLQEDALTHEIAYQSTLKPSR